MWYFASLQSWVISVVWKWSNLHCLPTDMDPFLLATSSIGAVFILWNQNVGLWSQLLSASLCSTWFASRASEILPTYIIQLSVICVCQGPCTYVRTWSLCLYKCICMHTCNMMAIVWCAWVFLLVVFYFHRAKFYVDKLLLQLRYNQHDTQGYYRTSHGNCQIGVDGRQFNSPKMGSTWISFTGKEKSSSNIYRLHIWNLKFRILMHKM